MKKIISMIILFVALTSIIGYTGFILFNAGVKKETTQKVTKTIVKVSSNLSNNILAEIYNIYLNEEKYKVKLEYMVDEEKNNVDLNIYLDGNLIIKQDVLDCEKCFLEDLTKDKNTFNIIGFDEKSFQIISTDKDYLIIKIGYKKDNVLQKYFIFDDNGKLVSDKNGIILFNNKEYISDLLDSYKKDDDLYLVKIKDNELYVLEDKSTKKKNIIEEYKYFIKDSKINKEKINTYEDIEIK
ncbi:MAG: hypothetical protein E7163_03470 [Firmicutes bacterium]|nr:hypothetical protein [Bacillota bacterium]